MSYKPQHPVRHNEITVAGTSLALTGLAGDTEGLYILVYQLEFANDTWSAQFTINGGETLLGNIAANGGAPVQSSTWPFAASGGGPGPTPAWGHGFQFIFGSRQAPKAGGTVQKGYAGQENNAVDSAAGGAIGQRIASGISRTGLAELNTLTIVTTVNMEPGSWAGLIPIAPVGMFFP